jgi:hypothetical protein
MHPHLIRDLVAERRHRFAAEAQQTRLVAEARAGQREDRQPHAAVRAVGRLLVALGSRLGGAIPAPAEPVRPISEGRATS